MVSKLLLTNCVQAHHNMLKVLRHMKLNLHLSTRRPQNIGFPGHAGTSFFEIPYLQEYCLSRPRKCLQNRQKVIKKNSRGCGPHPLRTGLRSSHPLRQVPNVCPQWCLLTMTVYLATRCVISSGVKVAKVGRFSIRVCPWNLSMNFSITRKFVALQWHMISQCGVRPRVLLCLQCGHTLSW